MAEAKQLGTHVGQHNGQYPKFSEFHFMKQTKSVIKQAMNCFIALNKPVIIIIMRAAYIY